MANNTYNGVSPNIRGRVAYIEPNHVHGTVYDDKGNPIPLAPQYEDMGISVALTAEIFPRFSDRKQGTGFVKSMSKAFLQWSTGLNGSFNAQLINGGEMLGQERYLTTYFTDISFEQYGEAEMVEGLGITSIQISYEHFMCPKITIKFVDVRGSSLFGREEAIHDSNDKLTKDNIFGVFFTLPYPLFRLQIKGFYGNAVTYQLTVASLKGNYNQNGNFEVTVEFIGYSYSLLTDIPFEYLIAAPYMPTYGNVYWNDMGGGWLEDNNGHLDVVPVNNGSVADMKDKAKRSGWMLSGVNGDKGTSPFNLFGFMKKVTKDKLTVDKKQLSNNLTVADMIEAQDKCLRTINEWKGVFTAFDEYLTALRAKTNDQNGIFYVGTDEGNVQIIISTKAQDGINKICDDDLTKNYLGKFQEKWSNYHKISIETPSLSSGLQNSMSFNTSLSSGLPRPMGANTTNGIGEFKLTKPENPIKNNLFKSTSFVSTMKKDIILFGGNVSNPCHVTTIKRWEDGVYSYKFDDVAPKWDKKVVMGNTQLNDVLKSRLKSVCERSYFSEPALYDYCWVIDCGNILGEINKQMREAQEKYNKVSYNSFFQTKDDKDIRQVMIDTLGFVPNIGNFIKVIMCHLETFVHGMYMVSQEVQKLDRRPGALGVSTSMTDIPFGMQSASSVNGAVRKHTPSLRLPEWVALYKKADDGSSNLEMTWPGHWANKDKFPEYKFVRELCHQLEVHDPSKKPEGAENGIEKDEDEAMFFELVPYDFRNPYSPFGNVSEVRNTSELYTHMGVRMAQVFSSYPTVRGGENKEFYAQLGKIDGLNFLYAQPRFNEIVKKGLDKDVHKMVNIAKTVLCAGTGLENYQVAKMTDGTEMLTEVYNDRMVYPYEWAYHNAYVGNKYDYKHPMYTVKTVTKKDNSQGEPKETNYLVYSFIYGNSNYWGTDCPQNISYIPTTVYETRVGYNGYKDHFKLKNTNPNAFTLPMIESDNTYANGWVTTCNTQRLTEIIEQRKELYFINDDQYVFITDQKMIEDLKEKKAAMDKWVDGYTKAQAAIEVEKAKTDQTKQDDGSKAEAGKKVEEEETTSTTTTTQDSVSLTFLKKEKVAAIEKWKSGIKFLEVKDYPVFIDVDRDEENARQKLEVAARNRANETKANVVNTRIGYVKDNQKNLESSFVIKSCVYGIYEVNNGNFGNKNQSDGLLKKLLEEVQNSRTSNFWDEVESFDEKVKQIEDWGYYMAGEIYYLCRESKNRVAINDIDGFLTTYNVVSEMSGYPYKRFKQEIHAEDVEDFENYFKTIIGKINNLEKDSNIELSVDEDKVDSQYSLAEYVSWVVVKNDGAKEKVLQNETTNFYDKFKTYFIKNDINALKGRALYLYETNNVNPLGMSYNFALKDLEDERAFLAAELSKKNPDIETIKKYRASITVLDARCQELKTKYENAKKSYEEYKKKINKNKISEGIYTEGLKRKNFSTMLNYFLGLMPKTDYTTTSSSDKPQEQEGFLEEVTVLDAPTKKRAIYLLTPDAYTYHEEVVEDGKTPTLFGSWEYYKQGLGTGEYEKYIKGNHFLKTIFVENFKEGEEQKKDWCKFWENSEEYLLREIPKWMVLLVGSIVWYFRHSGLIFDDYKVLREMPMKLDISLQNKLMQLFTDWVEDEFSVIQDYCELHLINKDGVESGVTSREEWERAVLHFKDAMGTTKNEQKKEITTILIRKWTKVFPNIEDGFDVNNAEYVEHMTKEGKIHFGLRLPFNDQNTHLMDILDRLRGTNGSYPDTYLFGSVVSKDVITENGGYRMPNKEECKRVGDAYTNGVDGTKPVLKVCEYSQRGKVKVKNYAQFKEYAIPDVKVRSSIQNVEWSLKIWEKKVEIDDFNVGTVLVKITKYPLFKKLKFFVVTDEKSKEGVWAKKPLPMGSFTIDRIGRGDEDEDGKLIKNKQDECKDYGQMYLDKTVMTPPNRKAKGVFWNQPKENETQTSLINSRWKVKLPKDKYGNRITVDKITIFPKEEQCNNKGDSYILNSGDGNVSLMVKTDVDRGFKNCGSCQFSNEDGYDPRIQNMTFLHKVDDINDTYNWAIGDVVFLEEKGWSSIKSNKYGNRETYWLHVVTGLSFGEITSSDAKIHTEGLNVDSNNNLTKETYENELVINLDHAEAYLEGFLTVIKNAEEVKAEEQKKAEGENQDNNNNKREAFYIQTYYNLKNLWDSWLNSHNRDEFTVRNFFKDFVFIDSFYQNIYEKVIINTGKVASVFNANFHENFLEGLGVKKNDKSIWVVLAQIAKDHNMLLFSLPDFLGYTESDKRRGGMSVRGEDYSQNESFNSHLMSISDKLSTAFVPVPFEEKRNIEPHNTFVFMYTHKPSDKSTEQNNFRFDGISFNDENTPFRGTMDWSLQGDNSSGILNTGIEETKDIKARQGLMDANELYRKQILTSAYAVPAFGVAANFGANSMFKTINVNMDNPVTTGISAETYAGILNRAGGDRTRRISFQGQDIYSVFSNYSYNCEIEMMGDAQIMPLMYFELLNMPMWKGAYLIYKVTHDIKPGYMTTKFTGMKMNRYLTPFAKDAWLEATDETKTKDDLPENKPTVEGDESDDCDENGTSTAETNNVQMDNNGLGGETLHNFAVRTQNLIYENG